MVALLLYVFALLHCGYGQQDPCIAYKTLKEPRRSVNFAVSDTDNKICDRNLVSGWYRFVSTAGGEMPTKAVSQNHCGTQIPGWLDGTHPTVADGEVDRKVCLNLPNSAQMLGGKTDCGISVDVKVKNCNGFYVYKLIPMPGCSMAYCAGTHSGIPCKTNQWSPTGFQPCVEKFPDMKTPPTLSGPTVKIGTFEFGCHVNFDPARSDVGFHILWLFNGKPDPKLTTQIQGNVRDASLDQKYLVGHMGDFISCAAEPYNKATPQQKGPAVTSNNYWMGIRTEPSRLTVGENDKEKTIKLVSTLPIVCPLQDQRSCSLEVYLDPNNHDLSMSAGCTQTLRPTDWNPTTHQATTSFQVLAQRDFKKDGDKTLLLHFNKVATGNAPPVFNGYNIPYMQVMTKDVPTSRCLCSGDPHCYTMDQMTQRKAHHFENYMIGEFVMYKSTTRPFEVQYRSWSCNHRAACICAVSAREGNDIVTIDMCHHNWGHTYARTSVRSSDPNGKVSQGTVVQKDASGKNYLISFPSGATVKLVKFGANFFNVEVTAPSDDFKKSDGLCGKFDHNIHNDLHHGNNNQMTSIPNNWPRLFFPNAFSNSWRIPRGTSLFDRTPAPDPAYNNKLYYCNCDSKKHLVDCRFTKGMNKAAVCPHCRDATHQLTHHRRYVRAAPHHTDVDNDDEGHYAFDYGEHYQYPNNTWPTPSGKTEADAHAICSRKLNMSPTVLNCIHGAEIDVDSMIDMCVLDFKELDTEEVVMPAIDAVISHCLQRFSDNETYINQTDGQLPEFLTSKLCPSDCSGNGVCVNGRCVCSGSFTGDDCSIDSSQPPALYKIIKGSKCDVQTRPCRLIYVMGDNLMNSVNLTCRLTGLKLASGRVIPGTNIRKVGVEFETSNHVACQLPTTDSGGVPGYDISVSNDGRTFSNTKRLIVLDSNCMVCADDGNACQIKTRFCYINNQCVAEGGTKPGDVFSFCNPAANKYAWTTLNLNPITKAPATTVRTTASTARVDIWTKTGTGCVCNFNLTREECACCDDGACQCPEGSHHQCTLCGNMDSCGTLKPSPRFGIDGFTKSLADCPCEFDRSQSNCACCQNNGCQCGAHHKNQCVECGHWDKCGKKPEIFGGH